MAERAVDPIVLAVVSGALTSIVAEMSVVMERTARSPVVALSHDYSNAVYTVANGEPEMVIQGEDQPCHLGGMLSSVKSAARIFANDIADGDVIVGNDPALNGTHLLDIDVIMPIFEEGRLIAWACCRAHEVDIGGPVPGGYNPHAGDIHAEGMRIPPIKLIAAGKTRQDVWDLIVANVRSDHLFSGDLGAQISAVQVAGRRVRSLVGRYDADRVEAAMAELLDRAERQMRAQIALLADGVHGGEQWIQDDARGSGDLRVGCTVEVAGDELRIALDSPAAVDSYRNSYPGLTLGAVYFAVIAGVAPGLTINEGSYRPLSVELGPSGSMLNAAHPQACAMSTGDVWTVVFDAVADAFAQAAPERATAGWTRVAIFQAAGVDPRVDEPYSSLLNIALMGGAGAVHGHDGGGLWGVIPTGGAATTGDVELLEARLPLHFHRHELATDSACPGRWRGAPGAIVEFEAVGHRALLTHVGDGTTFPPPSRGGGGSASDRERRVHRKHVVRHGGAIEPIPMHTLSYAEAGERIVVALPGGGGVGPALERDPSLVARDVAHGLVSVVDAEREYGVALDRKTGHVDEAATRALRHKEIYCER